MVKINNIEQEIRKIYLNGELFGEVDHLNFLDLRLQIIKENVEGFSIERDGMLIPINRYGNPESWHGIFAKEEHLLTDILKSQMEKRQNEKERTI